MADRYEQNDWMEAGNEAVDIKCRMAPCSGDGRGRMRQRQRSDDSFDHSYAECYRRECSHWGDFYIRGDSRNFKHE